MTDMKAYIGTVLAGLVFWIFVVVSGLATLSSISVLLVLFALLYIRVTTPWLNQLRWLAMFVVGVVLSLHIWPGFVNYPVWLERKFCDNCVPHSLWLNADKALLAVTLLPILAANRGVLKPELYSALLIGGVTLIACLGLGGALHVLSWDPKWLGGASVVFALVNLITVAGEEVLFRGVLQGKVLARLGAVHAWWLTALLFGAAHWPFSPAFAAVATVAGLGYGAIYWRTGSLTWAIILHWLINLVHFNFLTYPALQS